MSGTGLTHQHMVGQHMQITAGLIRLFGGDAAAACVLVMIQWRTQIRGYRLPDGTVWWRASLKDLADDTGLSRDQVNRLIRKLVAGGYLDKAQHWASTGDQRSSYRILFGDGETQLVDNVSGEVPPDLHVAIPPRSLSTVAIPLRDRGEIATVTVAISPSLPIRRLKDVQDSGVGGENYSPTVPVDKSAPPRPLPRPERCADHQLDVIPPNCGRCKDARLTLELVEAEVAHRPLAKCEHNHVSATCPYCPGGRLAGLEDVGS